MPGDYYPDNPGPDEPGPPSRYRDPGLSPREIEVLCAWLTTETKGSVASRLFIAPGTVNTHIRRIRIKYTAVGRPAQTKALLLARALQDKLLRLTDF